MIFPVAGNGNGSQAPAATNNTLRMSSDAGPILRNAERRYARSDLEDCTNIMKRTLAPSIPDILRSCGMEGTQLPATTAFRPRLGKALNEAYARLAAPKLPAAGMAQ